MRYAVLLSLSLMIGGPAMARDNQPNITMPPPLERDSETYRRMLIQQLMADTVAGPRLPYNTPPSVMQPANPNMPRAPHAPVTGPMVMPDFDPSNLTTPMPWEAK